MEVERLPALAELVLQLGDGGEGQPEDVEGERERHVPGVERVRRRVARHAVVAREHAPLPPRRELVGPVAPEVLEDEDLPRDDGVASCSRP